MSHYRINVSRDGRHLFATADHSISSEYELKIVLSEICHAFANRKDIKIDVTEWETVGHELSARSIHKLMKSVKNEEADND